MPDSHDPATTDAIAHRGAVVDATLPRLRPACAADHAAVADILIGARSAFMPYAPAAHPEHAVRSWVRDVVIPSGHAMVAELEGAVVGVMVTSVDDAGAWIDQMYVAPARVGRGIGARLLRHALGVLPKPVRLHAFQQNEGARRFYERHGFRPIAFTDGRANEERCPDVLYELRDAPRDGGA